ncbi:hypothetical protein [Devosia faecipullorum]|uniref:hypothetical protein n=1 Tax=Devosia faecipullorum TaxID=2755039 RepID=UPI00187B1958|nr:hypothetical protein [Devosia faecipullorum]MBE7734523.1 hypothetical protein [Devosia faecipullorum]
MIVWSAEAVRDVPRSNLRIGHLSSTAAFLLALVAFGLSAFPALLLKTQWAQMAGLGFSGFTVPDAISLETSVHLAWTIGWQHIPNIRTFLGTVLVYFPVTVWGSVYAVTANVVMLAVAATLFHSILKRVVHEERQTGAWFIALSIVATNVYLIACLFYPNKEIPLILLTTAGLWGLLHGKWLLVMSAIFLSYWFRDGYALILGMVLIVALSRRFAFVSGGVISTFFLLLLFLAFPITDMSAVDASLQRNVQIGSVIAGDKFSALGDIAAYAARLVGNAVNLALRPQMADVRGGWYLLGFGYWQFGAVLLCGLMWSVRNALSNDVSRSMLALITIVVVLGVTYGTFVQPRYMMPLIFPLTLGLSDSLLGRYVGVPAAIFLPIVFAWGGMLPPLAEI